MTRKTFNLRRERLKAELSQIRVATDNGISDDTIQRYEANGVPNKLIERGFTKYFEEMQNK